jgi:hypothetical protein
LAGLDTSGSQGLSRPMSPRLVYQFAQTNPDASPPAFTHMSLLVKQLVTLLDLCVSSLRRGHANLLCIVPILTDDPRRESIREGASGPRRDLHVKLV